MRRAGLTTMSRSEDVSRVRIVPRGDARRGGVGNRQESPVTSRPWTGAVRRRKPPIFGVIGMSIARKGAARVSRLGEGTRIDGTLESTDGREAGLLHGSGAPLRQAGHADARARRGRRRHLVRADGPRG